jgi:hypothetical protein
MSSWKPVLAIAVVLAANWLIAEPVAAATTRHLTCGTAYLVVPAPLVGNVNLSTVDIKNDLSFAIPAGTVFSYRFPAHSGSYKSPKALAPGVVLPIVDAAITATGQCDAWFTDNRFVLPPGISKLGIKQLKAQRTP